MPGVREKREFARLDLAGRGRKKERDEDDLF